MIKIEDLEPIPEHIDRGALSDVIAEVNSRLSERAEVTISATILEVLRRIDPKREVLTFEMEAQLLRGELPDISEEYRALVEGDRVNG